MGASVVNVCPLCIPEVEWPFGARTVLCSDCRGEVASSLRQQAARSERPSLLVDVCLVIAGLVVGAVLGW